MTRPPLTQAQVNRLVADCHFGLGPTADAGLWMRQELERCWATIARLEAERDQRDHADAVQRLRFVALQANVKFLTEEG